MNQRFTETRQTHTDNQKTNRDARVAIKKMPFTVFTGTRQELKDKVQELVDILTGYNADPYGISEGFFLSIGVAALGDIFDAYVIKARGGTDAMGIKWPPLKPETIAYGRRSGKGDAKMPGISPYRPSLTKAQNDRWKKLFVALYYRYQLSMDDGDAKSRAAATAWTILKSEGAKTKLELLGGRQVEILRDTGILLNSLSPGIYTGGAYTPASPEQIVKFNIGSVTVGTNVAYAAAHNYGYPPKGIPRRQFLPDDTSQVPEEWWQNWLDAAQQALLQSAYLIFGSNP